MVDKTLIQIMWVQKLNDNQGIKKDAVVWYIVEDILCGNNKLSLP